MWWNLDVLFKDTRADRQTNKQTDRHADHNTSHPYWERSKYWGDFLMGIPQVKYCGTRVFPSFAWSWVVVCRTWTSGCIQPRTMSTTCCPTAKVTRPSLSAAWPSTTSTTERWPSSDQRTRARSRRESRPPGTCPWSAL